MTFDLRDEPWIPVLRTDGTPTTLSLRETFRQAMRIQKISAELPTQSFALLRVMLAICHDAVGFHTMEDTARLLADGLDLDAIDAYLDHHSDRFDLFHPARPFMQVATLRTAKGEIAGLEKLISDVPNGNPFLTMRNGGGLAKVTAAEAAVWLVHAQAFDPSGIRSAAVGDPETSGGKGYPIGPSWSGQLGGVVLHGANLDETLRYNIVPTERRDGDVPVWAQPHPQSERRTMEPIRVGSVQLLTWQSRRIRLVGDRDGVTGLVLAQGDKMTPQNRHEVEAMTSWRYSKPQTKKFGIDVYMPLKHDPSRTAWRGLPRLITSAPFQEDGHDAFRPSHTIAHLGAQESQDLLDTSLQQLSLEVVGLDYGPQDATIAESVHDVLALPPSLLTEEAVGVVVALHDCIETADRVIWALGRMASNIAAAAGDFDGLAGASDSAKLQAWSALDIPARTWIRTLDAETDPIEARREWQRIVMPILRHEADRLARQAPPASVGGRQTSSGYMTAAKAEAFFRHKLRSELPLAFEEDTKGGTPR